MKKYDLILCDPPWEYQDTRGKQARFGGIPYETMSLDDLIRLPVKRICQHDCIMLMWSTGPMINDAMILMQSWGFKFKTIVFTWVKTTKNLLKTDSKGLGAYTLTNPEFLLLGTIGHPKRVSKAVDSIIFAPRIKHSHKPAEVINKIECLFGKHLNKIEIFAREKTECWDCWGLEIDGVSVQTHLEEY